MTIINEDRKPTDNMEALKQEAAACGPGCGCHAAGPSGRIRWIVGAVIILAAGALVARAMIKNNNATAEKTATDFVSMSTAGQASAPAVGAVSATNETPTATDTIAVQEIGALSDLNKVAADTGGVFVFLAGKNEPTVKAPLTPMRSAARTIESQARVKIGLFMLKMGSRDYEQIATQMPVPGVLAVVKGRGMSAVSGEITEPKLIQGFIAASRTGGCGPSSAGCGPADCN
ncbi:MAG: hypothetical protein KKG09_03465 [Verrucomicrobia bacterium]|nr:hypothetical protein [Verrucomicrobiota bacterium]MCG2678536.1 hypothetical protein [Kiritimatiellia bacterium]MBU4247451.1 hypothetical protein [Verrucomicrobiota bacterium]MBU4292282.1 hypothetical protein [Verrucomicrobiota bacterium]MBU4429829.1 hypothetical protein [Verrucomicrobiota bacterium]